MIKLLHLLKEVASENNLSQEDKAKLDQAKEILASLENLEEGALDESKISDATAKLKKLGLSAALFAILAATPNLSAAQEKVVDAAKPVAAAQVTNAPRTGTQVDGINGQFTSQFKFPKAFLVDFNTGKLADLGVEGNNALQQINKSGLTVKQMAEWNNFVSWMQSKGYSGDVKMDHIEFSNDVLEQYKKENPSFWITVSKDKKNPDIAKIQDVVKAYRTYTIGMWKAGKNDIKMSGDVMDVNNPQDVKRVESNYMSWAK